MRCESGEQEKGQLQMKLPLRPLSEPGEQQGADLFYYSYADRFNSSLTVLLLSNDDGAGDGACKCKAPNHPSRQVRQCPRPFRLPRCRR